MLDKLEKLLHAVEQLQVSRRANRTYYAYDEIEGAYSEGYDAGEESALDEVISMIKEAINAVS